MLIRLGRYGRALLLHERWAFAADAAAPGRARYALKHLLDELPADVLDDVLLLATELLTNSIRHAGCDRQERVKLEVTATGRAVVVKVTDAGSGEMFAPQLAAPTDASGRGLLLVAELADRWGIERAQATSVWFELSLSGAGVGVG